LQQRDLDPRTHPADAAGQSHDVKANAVGRQRPENHTELIANVRSYLRITQHHPAAVRRYFDAPTVRYAAA
jgi:hypothetical protein